MKFLFDVMFVMGMFLAWAIGGEYRFGKGKRGLLLAIPLTLYGLGVISWIGLVLQAAVLYGIYQCLFYDIGIRQIYDKNDKKGWLIVYLNGAMIGLTTSVFGLATGRLGPIIMGVLGGVMGFIGIVLLSNDKKFTGWRTWLTKNGVQYLPYKDDKGNPGYYINFKDAWWVSGGIMGAILGLILILAI